jgi:hypothetical protein
MVNQVVARYVPVVMIVRAWLRAPVTPTAEVWLGVSYIMSWLVSSVEVEVGVLVSDAVLRGTEGNSVVVVDSLVNEAAGASTIASVSDKNGGGGNPFASAALHAGS